MSEGKAFYFEVKGDALAVIPRIKDQQGLLRALCRATDRQNQFTVGLIQQKYMSGPTTDHSLSVRTNRFRGSIRASKAYPLPDGIYSSIGTNVSYAGPHEFGGTIHHPSRPRRGKVVDRLMRRAIRMGQKDVSFMTKEYDVTMPARAPMQHGITDRLPEYGPAIGQAVQNFWAGGDK